MNVIHYIDDNIDNYLGQIMKTKTHSHFYNLYENSIENKWVLNFDGQVITT